MRDLEHGRGAEGLCKLGAETGEAQVVQEDIALDLLRDVLHGARVGQTERLSPLMEGGVDIVESREDAVVRDEVGDGLLLLLSLELHGAAGRFRRREDLRMCAGLRSEMVKRRRLGWKRRELETGRGYFGGMEMPCWR